MAKNVRLAGVTLARLTALDIASCRSRQVLLGLWN